MLLRGDSSRKVRSVLSQRQHDTTGLRLRRRHHQPRFFRPDAAVRYSSATPRWVGHQTKAPFGHSPPQRCQDACLDLHATCKHRAWHLPQHQPPRRKAPPAPRCTSLGAAWMSMLPVTSLWWVGARPASQLPLARGGLVLT